MNKLKILDGALGTQLIKKGLALPDYVWSAEANIKNPEIIKNLYSNYINAGADYITTNTFRTTNRAYSKIIKNQNDQTINYKEQAKTSFNKAIEIAKSIATKKIEIIGSLAPLEDCYYPNLFPNKDIAYSEYSELGSWFSDVKVNILMLETMNSIIETEIAIHALKVFEIPIWVSFVLKDNQHLLSGEKLADALKVLANYKIETVLLNCNSIERTKIAMKILAYDWSGKWGIYPNLGKGEPSINGVIANYSSMQKFIDLIEKAANMGASILGGCCGSSHMHIKEIYKIRTRLQSKKN